MANPIEPLTIISANGVRAQVISTIKVGAKGYYYSASTSGYWAIMFDRTTLSKVVEVDFNDNTVVPPPLAAHASDSKLFMVLGTSQLSIQNVPHGPLAKFLYSQGAGDQLTKLQQLSTLFGTGNYSPAAYIFVGVPGDPSTHFEWFNTGNEYLAGAISLNTFGSAMYTPTELAPHS